MKYRSIYMTLSFCLILNGELRGRISTRPVNEKLKGVISWTMPRSHTQDCISLCIWTKQNGGKIYAEYQGNSVESVEGL